MRWVLVTGGAGFIGSHVVEALMSQGNKVVVFDNLSSGKLENIRQWIGKGSFKFVRGDLLNLNDIKNAVRECGIVFHLAANPEVRVGTTSPRVHFDSNIVATFNLLEAIKSSEVERFIFTSSSTVYGEATKIPTPEDCAPLFPISMYGASKLACEALIASYAYLHSFKALVLRLANVIGSRSRHGVIYDFVLKLKRNPRELEILGDGSQTKSYLYIDDCIDAILLASKNLRKSVEIFNVGSKDQVNVTRIAEIVTETLGLQGVSLKFTGGVDGGRGWKGDVKYMLLDVNKLLALGWKPKYNSEEAVRKTAASLVRKTWSTVA